MTPLTPVGLAIVAIAAIAMLLVSRRWAPVPLLLATCYMFISQGVEIAGLSFPAVRLIVLAGLLRVVLRGEFTGLRLGAIDQAMVLWALWALAVSPFHEDPHATFIFNGGLVFNTCGVYFLLRAFCRSIDDLVRLACICAVLLTPIALEMLYEKLASSNLFAVLGGLPDPPNIREGRLRAQGPFAHSILAGSVGATALPMCLGLWHHHRGIALLGTAASATMVIASTSSGPLLSGIFSVFALLLWHQREHVRLLRWAALIGYIALSLVMNASPYYLLARIDLTGGSTGYHRARLIESSVEHLNEWWLVGTDYTRHWMATGVTWSPNHTDITNHYLMLGVLGGLPLTLLLVFILYKCFSIVGHAVQDADSPWHTHRFFAWGLGASLFAHTVTCVSVSYFDQSFVFLYVSVAAIAALAVQRQVEPSLSSAAAAGFTPP
jgi:hypothetical protein